MPRKRDPIMEQYLGDKPTEREIKEGSVRILLGVTPRDPFISSLNQPLPLKEWYRQEEKRERKGHHSAPNGSFLDKRIKKHNVKGS